MGEVKHGYACMHRPQCMRGPPFGVRSHARPILWTSTLTASASEFGGDPYLPLPLEPRTFAAAISSLLRVVVPARPFIFVSGPAHFTRRLVVRPISFFLSSEGSPRALFWKKAAMGFDLETSTDIDRANSHWATLALVLNISLSIVLLFPIFYFLFSISFFFSVFYFIFHFVFLVYYLFTFLSPIFWYIFYIRF